MLGSVAGLLVVFGLSLGTEEPVYKTTEDVSTGMPPFVFLSPPTFKAGHTVSFWKTLLFTQFLLENIMNFTQRA